MASVENVDDDSCIKDPNFAVVYSFFENFARLCGVKAYSFTELQNLIDAKEVPQELIELHVRLMRKAKKNVVCERWERIFARFCYTYSPEDSWELEKIGYKDLHYSKKLKLLLILLQAQFDQNVKFKTHVNKLDIKNLRLNPIGKDKDGQTYWAQMDSNTDIRIYRENLDENTWDLQVRDRDGLVKLIDDLYALRNPDKKYEVTPEKGGEEEETHVELDFPNENTEVENDSIDQKIDDEQTVNNVLSTSERSKLGIPIKKTQTSKLEKIESFSEHLDIFKSQRTSLPHLLKQNPPSGSSADSILKNKINQKFNSIKPELQKDIILTKLASEPNFYKQNAFFFNEVTKSLVDSETGVESEPTPSNKEKFMSMRMKLLASLEKCGSKNNNDGTSNRSSNEDAVESSSPIDATNVGNIASDEENDNSDSNTEVSHTKRKLDKVSTEIPPKITKLEAEDEISNQVDQHKPDSNSDEEFANDSEEDETAVTQNKLSEVDESSSENEESPHTIDKNDENLDELKSPTSGQEDECCEETAKALPDTEEIGCTNDQNETTAENMDEKNGCEPVPDETAQVDDKNDEKALAANGTSLDTVTENDDTDVIEEPVMIITGVGSGEDCDTGNHLRENKDESASSSSVSKTDSETSTTVSHKVSNMLTPVESNSSAANDEQFSILDSLKSKSFDTMGLSEKKPSKLWTIDAICSNSSESKTSDDVSSFPNYTFNKDHQSPKEASSSFSFCEKNSPEVADHDALVTSYYFGTNSLKHTSANDDLITSADRSEEISIKNGNSLAKNDEHSLLAVESNLISTQTKDQLEDTSGPIIDSSMEDGLIQNNELAVNAEVDSSLFTCSQNEQENKCDTSTTSASANKIEVNDSIEDKPLDQKNINHSDINEPNVDSDGIEAQSPNDNVVKTDNDFKLSPVNNLIGSTICEFDQEQKKESEGISETTENETQLYHNSATELSSKEINRKISDYSQKFSSELAPDLSEQIVSMNLDVIKEGSSSSDLLDSKCIDECSRSIEESSVSCNSTSESTDMNESNINEFEKKSQESSDTFDSDSESTLLEDEGDGELLDSKDATETDSTNLSSVKSKENCLEDADVKDNINSQDDKENAENKDETEPEEKNKINIDTKTADNGYTDDEIDNNNPFNVTSNELEDADIDTKTVADNDCTDHEIVSNDQSNATSDELKGADNDCTDNEIVSNDQSNELEDADNNCTDNEIISNDQSNVTSNELKDADNDCTDNEIVSNDQSNELNFTDNEIISKDQSDVTSKELKDAGNDCTDNKIVSNDQSNVMSNELEDADNNCTDNEIISNDQSNVTSNELEAMDKENKSKCDEDSKVDEVICKNSNADDAEAVIIKPGCEKVMDEHDENITSTDDIENNLLMEEDEKSHDTSSDTVESNENDDIETKAQITSVSKKIKKRKNKKWGKSSKKEKTKAKEMKIENIINDELPAGRVTRSRFSKNKVDNIKPEIAVKNKKKVKLEDEAKKKQEGKKTKAIEVKQVNQKTKIRNKKNAVKAVKGSKNAKEPENRAIKLKISKNNKMVKSKILSEPMEVEEEENKPKTRRKYRKICGSQGKGTKTKIGKMKGKKQRVQGSESEETGPSEEEKSDSESTDNEENQKVKSKSKQKSVKGSRETHSEPESSNDEVDESDEDQSKVESEKQKPIKKGKTYKGGSKKAQPQASKNLDSSEEENSSDEANEVDADVDKEEAEKNKPVKKKRIMKCRRGWDGIDISNIKSGTDRSIRQSRRLAQLKIREQAESKYVDNYAAAKKMSVTPQKAKNASPQKPFGKYSTKKSKSSKDDSDNDESSNYEKPVLKKKKKKDWKSFNVRNPWKKTGDSSSEDDVDDEEHFDEDYEEEEITINDASDHEFSPESDLEDVDYEPVKRARTARSKPKQEEDTEDDDLNCQQCKLANDPEWILLCDKCDEGWHASCLTPPLMAIPEGDWFCPSCQHNMLIHELRKLLKTYDCGMAKRTREELRKQRLAYVGISLSNMIAQRAESKSAATSIASAASASADSPSADESTDDEPLYQLRVRRRANVSYRMHEYDELIDSAIREETGNAVFNPVPISDENASLIPDSTNANDTAAENNVETETQNEETPAEEEKVAPVVIQRIKKKTTQLTKLDVSDDDHYSDEDFKGPSGDEDDDEEEYAKTETDSDECHYKKSLRGPVRRSTRARVTRYDNDFIDDDSEEEEEDYDSKKRKRRSYSDSDSEAEDSTWGRKRRGKSNNWKTPKKKRRRVIYDDDSESEPRVKKSKKRRIQYGLDESDDDDFSSGRRTRGKKVNYNEDFESESEIESNAYRRRKALSDDEYVDDADRSDNQMLQKDDETNSNASTSETPSSSTRPSQPEKPVSKIFLKKDLSSISNINVHQMISSNSLGIKTYTKHVPAKQPMHVKINTPLDMGRAPSGNSLLTNYVLEYNEKTTENVKPLLKNVVANPSLEGMQSMAQNLSQLSTAPSKYAVSLHRPGNEGPNSSLPNIKQEIDAQETEKSAPIRVVSPSKLYGSQDANSQPFGIQGNQMSNNLRPMPGTIPLRGGISCGMRMPGSEIIRNPRGQNPRIRNTMYRTPGSIIATQSSVIRPVRVRGSYVAMQNAAMPTNVPLSSPGPRKRMKARTKKETFESRGDEMIPLHMLKPSAAEFNSRPNQPTNMPNVSFSSYSRIPQEPYTTQNAAQTSSVLVAVGSNKRVKITPTRMRMPSVQNQPRFMLAPGAVSMANPVMHPQPDTSCEDKSKMSGIAIKSEPVLPMQDDMRTIVKQENPTASSTNQQQYYQQFSRTSNASFNHGPVYQATVASTTHQLHPVPTSHYIKPVNTRLTTPVSAAVNRQISQIQRVKSEIIATESQLQTVDTHTNTTSAPSHPFIKSEIPTNMSTESTTLDSGQVICSTNVSTPNITRFIKSEPSAPIVTMQQQYVNQTRFMKSEAPSSVALGSPVVAVKVNQPAMQPSMFGSATTLQSPVRFIKSEKTSAAVTAPSIVAIDANKLSESVTAINQSSQIRFINSEVTSSQGIAPSIIAININQQSVQPSMAPIATLNSRISEPPSTIHFVKSDGAPAASVAPVLTTTVTQAPISTPIPQQPVSIKTEMASNQDTAAETAISDSENQQAFSSYIPQKMTILPMQIRAQNPGTNYIIATVPAPRTVQTTRVLNPTNTSYPIFQLQSTPAPRQYNTYTTQPQIRQFNTLYSVQSAVPHMGSQIVTRFPIRTVGPQRASAPMQMMTSTPQHITQLVTRLPVKMIASTTQQPQMVTQVLQTIATTHQPPVSSMAQSISMSQYSSAGARHPPVSNVPAQTISVSQYNPTSNMPAQMMQRPESSQIQQVSTSTAPVSQEGSCNVKMEPTQVQSTDSFASTVASQSDAAQQPSADSTYSDTSAVRPETNEDDETPVGEFGGLVSYFSSQQDDLNG